MCPSANSIEYVVYILTKLSGHTPHWNDAFKKIIEQE